MPNPYKLEQMPEPENPTEGADVEKEAAELGKKLSEKTFGEKVFSEYQTRKVPLEQQSKRIQKTERGESARFERGQIYKAYKILRKEIREAEKDGERAAGKRGLLEKIRSRAKIMERDIDELERQFKHNVRIIEVETELGKFSVPVTELDLKKDLEPGEDDKRIPYIFWGGIGSTVEMNGCIAAALALAGQRVIGMPHLEQKEVKKPASAKEISKGKKNFGMQAGITRAIAENAGLKNYNIVGYSTGANIALETAISLSNDPESKGRLNDLILIEPVGLDEQGVAGLATGLGADIIKELVPSSEGRIKVLGQGAETNKQEQKLPFEIETVRVLGKKQFTAERLSQIEVAGSFQWWVGRSSGLTSIPLTERVVKTTQELMKKKNPDAHLPQLNEVVNGTHFLPNMNAIGLAEMIVEGREGAQAERPKIIKRKDLANSAMAGILKQITGNKNTERDQEL